MDLLTTLPDVARLQGTQTAVERALAETDGNLTAAAKLLGVSRPTVYNLMRQLDLKAD